MTWYTSWNAMCSALISPQSGATLTSHSSSRTCAMLLTSSVAEAGSLIRTSTLKTSVESSGLGTRSTIPTWCRETCPHPDCSFLGPQSVRVMCLLLCADGPRSWVGLTFRLQDGAGGWYPLRGTLQDTSKPFVVLGIAVLCSSACRREFFKLSA